MTVTLIAPSPFQKFATKSGNTYVSDASSNVGGIAIGDILDMVNMGCGYLTGIPAIQPVTDAATITWTLSATQPIATLTLGGNRTLANPPVLAVGAYDLIVKQDGAGSRTLAYGNVFKWPGGTAPTLSTAANAIDILSFLCDGTNMLGVAQFAFA